MIVEGETILFEEPFLKQFHNELKKHQNIKPQLRVGFHFYNYQTLMANLARNEQGNPVAQWCDPVYAMCAGGIDEDYVARRCEEVATQTDKFDLLLVLKTNAKNIRNQQEFNENVLGFVVAELGECKEKESLFSINLICTGCGIGQVLMACFLYCVKQEKGSAYSVGSSKTEAVLELAKGYVNMKGLCLYQKFGFVPDESLSNDKCFDPEFLTLPMHCKKIPHNLFQLLAEGDKAPKEGICAIANKKEQMLTAMSKNIQIMAKRTEMKVNRIRQQDEYEYGALLRQIYLRAFPDTRGVPPGAQQEMWPDSRNKVGWPLNLSKKNEPDAAERDKQGRQHVVDTVRSFLQELPEMGEEEINRLYEIAYNQKRADELAAEYLDVEGGPIRCGRTKKGDDSEGRTSTQDEPVKSASPAKSASTEENMLTPGELKETVSKLVDDPNAVEKLRKLVPESQYLSAYDKLREIRDTVKNTGRSSPKTPKGSPPKSASAKSKTPSNASVPPPSSARTPPGSPPKSPKQQQEEEQFYDVDVNYGDNDYGVEQVEEVESTGEDGSAEPEEAFETAQDAKSALASLIASIKQQQKLTSANKEQMQQLLSALPQSERVKQLHSLGKSITQADKASLLVQAGELSRMSAKKSSSSSRKTSEKEAVPANTPPASSKKSSRKSAPPVPSNAVSRNTRSSKKEEKVEEEEQEPPKVTRPGKTPKPEFLNSPKSRKNLSPQEQQMEEESLPRSADSEATASTESFYDLRGNLLTYGQVVDRLLRKHDWYADKGKKGFLVDKKAFHTMRRCLSDFSKSRKRNTFPAPKARRNKTVYIKNKKGDFKPAKVYGSEEEVEDEEALYTEEGETKEQLEEMKETGSVEEVINNKAKKVKDSGETAKDLAPKVYGTKEEVFNGLAYMTTGGLKKEDLVKNSSGRVVSKERSEWAKKFSNLKNNGFYCADVQNRELQSIQNSLNRYYNDPDRLEARRRKKSLDQKVIQERNVEEDAKREQRRREREAQAKEDEGEEEEEEEEEEEVEVEVPKKAKKPASSSKTVAVTNEAAKTKIMDFRAKLMNAVNRGGKNKKSQRRRKRPNQQTRKQKVMARRSASRRRSYAGGRRRSRRYHGGAPYGSSFLTSAYNGAGVGTSGVDLQFVAGNATGGRRRRRTHRGHRRSRGRRTLRSYLGFGGSPYGSDLLPTPYDGRGVGTSGVDLQFVAGNAN